MGMFDRFAESKDNKLRDTISIKNLIGETFVLEEISLVKDVDTHFGVKDLFVMNILLDDVPYAVWVSQQLVMKKLQYLLDENIDYRYALFTILKKTGRSGNSYYDIVEVE